MYSSEVTPSVWNSTMSTSIRFAKPMIAPVIEPHSSPTDITTSGVRSALTPKIEICEIAASWITTATNASSDETQRQPERGRVSRHLRPLVARRAGW